jgi:hypothetical protein
MNYKSNGKRIQDTRLKSQCGMFNTVRDGRRIMASFPTDPEIYRALKRALLRPLTRGGR